MPEVAQLQVVVNADTSQAESQLQGFGGRMTGMLGGAATAAGAALAAGIAGVGVALGASVKSAADFEKQISAISAVSGASASELEALRATALQLGKDTSFSASEAAVGMEELVKAGVSLADVMGGAGRASLDLAAAGAISVGDAAEIASNAMNVFNLKGADMAHVADVIAGAANASAIGVNDYKFSLAAAGAVANTVGISFESLSTAIAVMGQAGIKGSDAGTSLKTMLLNLQPTTKAQISLFRELGILTADGANKFFDASGKAKDFAGIAQVLQDALKGMTKQQQLATLEVMFGSDAIRAGAVLLDAGAAGFNEMAEAMGKVTAQAVANERLNNLWGSVEKLKGSLETGAIILGSFFTPALKDMADAATEGVNAAIEALDRLPDAWLTLVEVFSGEDVQIELRELLSTFGLDKFAPAVYDIVRQVGAAFRTLQPYIETVASAFDGMAGPIAAAVSAFLGVIATAGAMQAAIAAVTAVLTFMLSPLGLVAVAAAALALAWTTNFLGIQEATATMWAAIQPTFAALVDWLGVQIPLVLNWITTVGWPALVAAGTAFATWVTSTAIPALTQLIDWLGPQLTAVVTWITETGWPGLVTAATTVSAWITATAIPALTQLVDWLGPKLQPVVEWISGTGWPALVTAGTAVGTMLQAVITYFQQLYVELEKRGVFTELQGLWTTLVAVGNTLWQMLETAAGWFAKLTAAMQPANEAVGALAAATGLAAPSVSTLADAIKFAVDQVVRGLKPLQDFVAAMDALSKIQLPSFSIPGFGGGSGGGSGATTLSLPAGGGGSLTGGSGANPAVLQWSKEINAAAAAYGISPSDLAGLVDLESSGNPRARSGAGAMGLGQVMPFHFKPGEDPYDPQTNLMAAARVYRSQLDKYGDPSRAAAGYFGAGDNLNASDGSATGHDYIRIFNERRQRYQSAPAAASSSRDMMRMPLDGMPSQWTPQDMQDVIDLGPPWERTMETVQTTATEAGQAIATSMGAALVSVTDLGGGSTLVITQMGTDVTAQIVNMAGQVTSQYGAMTTAVQDQNTAMTTAVPAQIEGMSQASLTSVTNLGTGIMTTTTTSAGSVIATVADMSGQVTAQYATLSSGAQLSMADMGNGILASTTQLEGGVLTIMQDMSGNTIATITDMSGNVVSQTVSMANETTAAAAQMAAGAAEQAQQMQQEVVSAADATAAGVEEAMNNIEIQAPDTGDVISELKKVQKEAEKTKQSLDELDSERKSKGDDGGDGPKKKKSSSGKKESDEADFRGFATGGVVWEPETVNVAEREPEAIIPLSKLSDIGIGGSDEIVALLRDIREKLDRPNVTLNTQATAPLAYQFESLQALAGAG